MLGGGGDDRFERGVERRQLQILRPADGRARRSIQQGVQVAFTSGAFLAHTFQLEFEDAQLGLRFRTSCCAAWPTA